jgi:hypothetical protein
VEVKVRLSAHLVLAALLGLSAPSASFAADAAAGRTEDPIANPLASKALDHLPATLARPLFVPARSQQIRAPTPVVHYEAPPPVVVPPPAVKLLGILRSADTARAALVFGAPPKTMRVKIGDQVGGWTVTEIADRHVTLSLDARTTTIDLFKDVEPRKTPEPRSLSADPWKKLRDERASAK